MQETVNIKNTNEWPCGQTIVAIRTMTDSEMAKEGWTNVYRNGQNPTCIELSDSSVIYPSCDEEGNAPGMFFGYAGDVTFTISLSRG